MMFRDVGGHRVFRLRTLEGQDVEVLPAGIRELAERYRVQRSAPGNWRTRYEGFPEPLLWLASGPVYDGYELDRWRADQGDRFGRQLYPFPR